MQPLLAASFLCVLAAPTLGQDADSAQRVVEHLRIAARHFDAKKFEDAVSECSLGLKVDPKNYNLRGILAWSRSELGRRPGVENERQLVLAEEDYRELIALRSVEKHDPKNVFGYAVVLYDRARMEERKAEANRRRTDGASEDKAVKIRRRVRAQERSVQRRDAQAHAYFLRIAEADHRANRRESYGYLMEIEIRGSRFAAAAKFGEKHLELCASQREYWTKEAALTEFVRRRELIESEIAKLSSQATKVRSRLVECYTKAGDPAAAARHSRVLRAGGRNKKK